MKKKIILVGSGGHATSTINLIESNDQFKIIGIVDKVKKIKKLLGYPIIGTDKDIKKIFKLYTKNCCIGIGQIKSHKIRTSAFNRLKKIGFKFPIIISKNVIINKSSQIGEGTTIFHNCIINSKVLIGKNCIINNGAIIEHDSIIGDNCHISTGAIINGSVKIGKNSFIGSGAIIKNNIEIGNNVVVGMGKKIKKNIKSNSVIK